MMERHKAKMIASRSLPTAAIMEAFMANAGFGHHWIRDSLAAHYESDGYEDYDASDFSDDDWMPEFIF